jgi:two-component system cell cycle response regulator DivK
VTARPPAAGPGGATAAAPPLVLIVDDNARNRKLARDVLNAAGFRTVEAGSGGDAIVQADREQPDVILMDLGLPDMDGVAATQRLRQRERTARIPVVALTSIPSDGDDWLLGAGFDGYLEKPIDIREFPARVGAFCPKHRAPPRHRET